MYTPASLLDAAQKALASKLGDYAVNPWFLGVEPLGIIDGIFYILAENDIVRDVLQKRFTIPFSTVCLDITGEDITPKYLDATEGRTWRQRNDTNGVFANYTFEHFIVGSSNKFAHAAAYAVAHEPAAIYNPLFIYGPSGLGKTHLLYAIAGEIRKRLPDFNIVYKKGDDFTNELVESIRNQEMHEFREKYRKADLLLIDDIQFIAGKTQTQEEFFHTFNTLYESHKQVVLTSDRPPKEIDLLVDRLRSRFEAGLLADIQPPDLEMRMALVQNKSRLYGMVLPNDVCEYIATSITNNVRELEGAVKKLFAMRDLMNKEIDVALAQETLIDLYKNRPGLNPTPKLILEEVCSFFDITTEKIFSSSRAPAVVFPRQIAIYLMRELTKLSLSEIGKFMNGMHHTTIIHSIDRIESDMAKKEEVRAIIKDLRQNIEDR